MTSGLLEEPQMVADIPLLALATFEGPLEAFWPALLQALVQASGARRALLLSSAVGLPWQARSQWPVSAQQVPDDARRSLRLLGRLATEPVCFDAQSRDLAFRPALSDSAEVLAVLLLDLPETVDQLQLHSMAETAGALTLRVMSASTAAASRQPLQAVTAPDVADESAEWSGTVADKGLGQQSPAEPTVPAGHPDKTERLFQILRLAQSLSEYTRFTPAAMALCNQLCSRYGADRVSLGWQHGPGIRLAAISHVEHFDAKSNVTRALEELMEEALDQQSLLVYPPAPDTLEVLHAHGNYARMAAPAGLTLRLASVPLDGADGVDGVLCLERLDRSFEAAELWEMQQAGQAVRAWLAHLRQRDRWFGLRWWEAGRRSARTLLGPRHTVWKVSALALALFVGVGSVWPWNYRVDATLAVRSRDLLFMPAPFDGYLRQVHVDVGDQVTSGATLVELDTRDLLLEASMAEADLVRYTREAEKAMAARQLAEMQIALARQQQAQAKLELTRYQLANARLKAPYDGVVIEGELKKNLGAPVRKGDLLLKLARSTRTYLELEIDQAYVHEVQVGTLGEFALVGRPGERFPIRLTQLDPAAVTKDGRTVYLARAALVGSHQPDWRPGMGGNARLDAGERPLIWVLTHRTVRFLREFFWL